MGWRADPPPAAGVADGRAMARVRLLLTGATVTNVVADGADPDGELWPPVTLVFDNGAVLAVDDIGTVTVTGPPRRRQRAGPDWPATAGCHDGRGTERQRHGLDGEPDEVGPDEADESASEPPDPPVESLLDEAEPAGAP